MTTVRLKRKAKGERPYFFADPNVDKVIAMVMGLAGEVAVMRDRLDTVERLLEGHGLRRADIDAYQPSAEVAAERAAWREAFLGEVLRIVEIEIEALASGDNAPYDEAITLVEPPPSTTATRRPARAAPTRAPVAARKSPARKPPAKKAATSKTAAKKAPARKTAPRRAARKPRARR